ncbi:unnamed protein product, partial [Vitis vinifera]|uniref:Uncharacterized protein n=1 Tax=Vitis vinifera TaxID=29760 RepID=D7T3P8_VITVI
MVVKVKNLNFSLLPQATTCFTMPHSEGMPPSPTTTMGELLMLTTRPRMKLHERCPPHATGFLNRESPRGSLRAFHLQRNISCIENENKPQMGCGYTNTTNKGNNSRRQSQKQSRVEQDIESFRGAFRFSSILAVLYRLLSLSSFPHFLSGRLRPLLFNLCSQFSVSQEKGGR